MPVTRIKSQDINDGDVKNADIAAGAVTFPKLTIGTNGCIEDDGTGAHGIRAQVDGTSMVRSSSGLAVQLFPSGGLLNATSGAGVRVRGAPGLTAQPGTWADGDFYYDTTTTNFVARASGQNLKLSGLLDITTADSANVANTLVETTVYTFTFPASYFVAGKAFELEFDFEYSTDPAAAAPAIFIQVKLAGSDIADSGILTLPQNASNFRGNFSGQFVCRATGNPASFGRSGGFIIELGAAGTGNYFRPAGGAAFSGGNTAATIALTITVGWGTALATNTAHLHQVVLRALN